MNPSSIKQHWVAILLATLITFVASVALTVVQPMEYRSDFTILVLEKNQSLDGYAAAKAAERLSASLGQAITTASFADRVYDQLKDSPTLKDNPIISADVAVRRDQWKRRIETKVLPDVGMVKVSIYQKDRTQADTIANALSISAIALGGDYLSDGNSVDLKIVDYPLTSKSPVRPNVFLNLAAGLVIGFGGALVLVLLFAGQNQTVSPYANMIVAPVTPAMLSAVQAPSQPVAAPAPMPVAQQVPLTNPMPGPSVQHHAAPATPATATKHAASPTNLPVDEEWVMP